MRQELQKVIRYWMAKGVKGFRFDVINLVSKGSFEDDPDGDGRRFYTDGPKIHEYLRELNEATFGQDVEIITVGEMSSTSMENCFRYAGEGGKELSMVFNFHHLKVDFMGNEKWVLVPADFGKLKQILFSWQVGMARHHAWNAVFCAITISREWFPGLEMKKNTGRNRQRCWERLFTACAALRISIREKSWA